MIQTRLPTHGIFQGVDHKKPNKRGDKTTLGSIKKEMAKPRVAKSARIAEVNLAAKRVRASRMTIHPIGKL